MKLAELSYENRSWVGLAQDLTLLLSVLLSALLYLWVLVLRLKTNVTSRCGGKCFGCYGVEVIDFVHFVTFNIISYSEADMTVADELCGLTICVL